MLIGTYAVHAINNGKYVERGRMLILHDDDEWPHELKKANRHKNGAPFRYAESLFVSLAIVRSMMQIPYRQMEGMTSETIPGIQMPSYSTIFRRIQNLNVQEIGGMITVSSPDGSRHVFSAIDASGVKVAKRGEWLRHKWKVKRSFIKMHILVDTDTGIILALKVTDETVGDSKMFVPLVEQAFGKTGNAAENVGVDSVTLLGDNLYATKTESKDRSIKFRARLKINSTTRGRGTGDAWGLAVRDQLGGSPVCPVWTLSDEEKVENQKRWKERVGYGRRWIIEIVFSAFKRIFGDCVMATKKDSMIHEIMLKVATYNRITAIGGWG